MANSPSHQDDNPSYAKLRNDLADDFALLNFLPFKRATFQRQNEIQKAAPDRILYGDMMDEKDQVWIYFTLHKADKKGNWSDGARMISFYTLKGAQEGQNPLRPSTVQQMALASWPFKHARDHFAIMAIAKYFFIRRGIDSELKFPLSVQPFRDDLLRACRDYQALYNQTQATKKAATKTGGTVDATPSQLLRALSRTASVETTLKRAHSSTSPRDTQGGADRLSLYSPTPTAVKSPRERLNSAERASMVEQYVTLQAREEELNDKIDEVEEERGGIAAQVAELQADLNAVEDRKYDLEEEKSKVRSEKKCLQSSLELDEQLEFGFEAGREMERKRLRKE